MRLSWLLLALFICRASGTQTVEEEWPACDTAAADKASSDPICDPCSPNVYTEFNNDVNTEVFQKYATALKNYQLKGWTRFGMGTGKVIENCPMMYSCGSTYPTWLNSRHPSEEDGITEGEMCTHYTNGNCCTYKEDIYMKNCGTYYVYLLTYNKPMSSSYSSTYCVEPEQQPDVCNDEVTFTLLEDVTHRGELQTTTSTTSEPINIDNHNKWYSFSAGKGTIKRTCPGIHHCGFRYPMWIDDDYPTEEGKIMMTMGHAATSEANICSITNSQPVYIVKCGEKFYHKLDRVVTYSGFCIDEDYSDLCESAETLSETWRGTTVDKARDHCDTNGLTDFNDWYRIGVYQKKMPEHCVAPNRCGADNGYFVGGNLGHPDPGDGIVGRIFYYSTAATCTSSSLQGHILNCGDRDEDDFIYKWSKPSGCDKVFCAEENPCSSTVYTKLNDPGRAGREFSAATINDANTQHGWYRFTAGEGIMPRSPVLPGHSGATYPGWYDGEYPMEDGDERTGRACFVYNGNTCWNNREVTVKNCKNFYVYHLKTTGGSWGYTYEQDVCKLETMKLDQEWRLQYNLDAVTVSDNTLKTGWYEVTVGLKELATTRTLFKHGGSGKYAGWMEGGHPTEDEGIVERTVYFTTTDVQPKGSSTKVYVRNCGSKYMYYLKPHSTNYFYAVAENLCQDGSYVKLDQDYRLYSNPSEKTNVWNSDNKLFKTFTNWYRFMNGNGRIAEYPKVDNFYYGGFQYPYQFPDESHASVPNAGDMVEDILMEHYRGAGNERYTGWPWKISIANCGNYFLYRIPPLHSSYNRAGLVVDDDPESVCNANRYTETDDQSRLVSSTNKATGTSDFYLGENWYRLTAGLGYMPTAIFIGTQCSSTYHGHLRDDHPAREDGIVENLVQFRSTSATTISYSRIIWVKACDGFYVYRLRESPGNTCRYCEATPGCDNARELEDFWRVNSKQLLTGQYESKSFGNDGWVYFTIGLGRMPEAPPPKAVGGCTYNGYIDSHPARADGAVPRTLRFPGVDFSTPIQVENCGDGRYVYFLSSSIKSDYCYVADTDVCSDDVYTVVDDKRRLHYSHKYGTTYTRFNLDNTFNGWIRYTIGEGRMMEEAPALTGMCTTEYMGWIDGTHPTPDDGVVKRKVCWKYGGNDCHSEGDISIKNCGQYYVYGISSPPSNNQYGYCVEQDKTAVCESATQLYNEKRGMLTPTTEYIHDQTKILDDGYYRFTSGLGRLTSFPVKSENCGGTRRVLIKQRLEIDGETGDTLLSLQEYYSSGWTGTVYRNIGLQCNGYWVYRLFNIATNQLAYCVEEDVCESLEIKNIFSTNYLQWLEETTDNEWHKLSTGWYQIKVGNKRLAYSPADLYDCSAKYPGYIDTPAPSLTDGIVPGRVCYRTSDSADPSTCYDIYQKKCKTKELYYLKKSPSSQYAICVETDVCTSVDGTALDDTWRLSATPAAAGGYDKMAIGWYRVHIGNEKLAVTRDEANCGATYPGWMTLGRHPNVTEGTVNTKICYNTGGAEGANCKQAQVVNCGSHYLYHLRPATTHYGLCVSSSEDSMCSNYQELNEAWRSTEYSATIVNTDTSMESGWYRFTVGLGRMAFHCPAYQHGGGYYPSYATGIDELPPVESGIVQFTIQWSTSSSCTAYTKTGYVRNCGEYPVYWLPKQTSSYTTYNTEANSCSEDQYTVLDDERRLAWKPTTDFQADNQLTQGWYRFANGLRTINEECTPPSYGGTNYPGWMEGGHPDVGDVADRVVQFRHGTNCKQTSTRIKVKNCGSFYLYRLVPTAASRGYTVASEPCDVEPMLFEEEDRSIYTRSTSYTHDNAIQEGWYQFDAGTGVMPKRAPMAKSCKTSYPVWLNGEDPSQEEGIVTRTICVVNGATECNWQKEIKVRNCGNNKMLYYLYYSPPHTSARYCVDDTMDNICNSARSLDEEWRGANKPGTGHADRLLQEGWYKFTAHAMKLANYPVPSKYCGSTYPIYMDGSHVERGSCASQSIIQVNSDTNWSWRSGYLYECQCMNGDYIYYHVPGVAPLTSYEGSYCVEQDPCSNFDRYTGNNRSPWYSTVVNHGDHAKSPRWIKIDTGLGTMPQYTPEQPSCGSTYAAWYDGEHPTEVGQMTRGRYCWVTSATALCSSARDARVLKCEGAFLLYHVLPTASYQYGYCADDDVCGVASEEWGREENDRLRHTSTTGYYSSTRKADTSLPSNWFRITAGLKMMPTECVGYMSCGVLYPGWLNGEHPVPADRIVDRTVCFVQAATESCCAATKQIKVVACVSDAGEQFYLYRLYKTAANQAYCIDEASDDVCSIDSSDIKHITDERHGTGHYRDSNFKPDYQLYPIPGWFQVNMHDQVFIHYPPIQYFCGGVYAGWVADPQPGPNDGVISSRACYRNSMANEDCGSSMPLKMKNCNGRMRYLYAPAAAATRNMCVEEDICDAANHRVFDGETWRLAYAKTVGTDYKTDYRKMDTSPYRGWFKFTGAGNNRITEIQQEYMSCGVQAPGWLSGGHPTTDDGVVKRILYLTTSATAYTGQNSEIFVKNCGDFMLYNMNFNWYNAKWGMCIDTDVCLADVTELADSHRLVNTWGVITSTYDSSLARGWYRFKNGFEKMPETCPIANSCGSTKPGYLSQPHPEIGEGIVERKVCFGDADQCCVASRDILVKNCGTHFVYRLYPTTTYEKYCVEESPDGMCDTESYTVIDDARRGENNPYNSADKYDDSTLVSGWYRFTNFLGRIPEYSMSSQMCGIYYPGYLKGQHPSRTEGVINSQICYSTSLTNEGQSCQAVRVKNCGSYYLYQLTKSHSTNYGFCVAQDQCTDATALTQRWRLVVNPTVSGQSAAADNSLKKGWYRLAIGHGTLPDYEPDTYHGGATYPSWMQGGLPSTADGEVERTARFGGTTGGTKEIRVKNCGEHYIFWLQPTAAASYVYSIDTDVCLHAFKLAEEWRNQFYVSEGEDDRHTDYNLGKDWYQFPTGFKMMAEAPPLEQYSCGTLHPAYLNQAHPTVEDGVVPREVCYKEDEVDDIYQACFAVENIRVKNCGEFYAYQLNPVVQNGAYCVYNRKTSCEPKVVHAKYGELAVVNCTLNSEKDFDSSEVSWTKLNSMTLPDDSLSNIEISENKLLLKISDITDDNTGVYALYIPSTATHELVEVILYNAVETAHKYYVLQEGDDVQIDVDFKVEPVPSADKISWKKLPNKHLNSDKYSLNAEKNSLTITGVTATEAGTYRCQVQFEVDGVSYTKHSDVIVQLEEEE